MAERSVVVRLRAEVADFKRQLAEATKAVEGVGNQAKQTSGQGGERRGVTTPRQAPRAPHRHDRRIDTWCGFWSAE